MPTRPPLTLHAIIDPYCSWCYAAAPLLNTARVMSQIKVTLHAGGMLVDETRVRISPTFRTFVMQHGERVTRITKQPFGKAYYNGLLCDSSAVLDSLPPTTAILAVQALGSDGLDMLHLEQQAHHVDGLRIAEFHVLAQLAQELGLDEQAFAATYQKLEGKPTRKHIAQSRELLNKIGSQGFPTLALESCDGHWKHIDLGIYLGQTSLWKQYLLSCWGAQNNAG